MKKKLVEKMPPTKTKKKGLVATVQTADDILILNVYRNKELQARYCMNVKTGEYMQQSAKTQGWAMRKFINACGYESLYHSAYWLKGELKFNSWEEEKLAKTLLGTSKYTWKNSVVEVIDDKESDYLSERREKTENNHRNRVQSLMDQVPDTPEDIKEWIHEVATGNADFAFYNKDEDDWSCTNCGKYFPEKYLHRTDGEKKVRHNDYVMCPRCRKEIQAKKRTNKQEVITHFMILQPVNEKCSVARHFDVKIFWQKDKREIRLSESMRIILNKKTYDPKTDCSIYYNQYSTRGVYSGGWGQEYAYFDNKGNPANRRTYAGYLYGTDIEDSLKDTYYEDWTRVFTQMAAVGQKVQYDRLMAVLHPEKLVGVVEYLFKGRFHRLLLETSEGISYWSGSYVGLLRIEGDNLEEIFGICDKQKINRIRDMNGGNAALEWMRYSDETGEKIPQETLEWLEKNHVDRDDIGFIEDKMSIQQIVNYIKRQQVESYKGQSVGQVLNQWKDYIRMCTSLKKKLDDEMIYKPRELKRRHDEAVAEIQLRNAEIRADEYANRFPGAEDVLREIKPKFEYENEEYKIVVPERLIEIVSEGNALHHCAGSSDRYFDRIVQRETYICFLRKRSEPDKPYYTIEVEPGGTIRQHRGYLDEEPEIELVKPFLKEWQKYIKKNLSKKDMEYAEASAVKREENIEELRQKNNTRVLKGLMEDFMAAV